jgi:integrase
MKTKPEKFPLNIRRGSSTVKIYRDRKPAGDYFILSFYMGGKRVRQNFADLDTARVEAEAKAAQLSRGDLDALQITGKDRLVYGRALAAIAPLDVPLDTAAHEYAEARKKLAGGSLAEAVSFYVKHHAHVLQRKPVAEAVEEMIAAKAARGLSAAYLMDLRCRLGAFARAFACNVSDITADDLRAFLDSLPFAARGINNTLTTIRTFIAFAKDRGWLSRESRLLDGIEKQKEKAAPVEIFTPAEMRELLAHCSAEIRPALAIAAFAGLRTAELLRLTWADVDRRPGFVEISADKAKTAARRLVPISGNLRAWLALSPRTAGRIWPQDDQSIYRELNRTVKRINAARKTNEEPFAWKDNALRHSFVSYRLAETQDVNRVALEAGNSPQMIFKHYRELCTPAEAQTWFSLAPDEAANVIPMEAAR